MKYCYYPGCTLKNKAKIFDFYCRKICEKFNIELFEIDEWQCCGGLYSFSNDLSKKLPSIRNLVYAKEKNMPLMTLCASCHNVLKRVNDDIKNNSKVMEGSNKYLELEPFYNGETDVVHFIEMITKDVGLEKLKQELKIPLNKKVACYYGCQLLRPSYIMNFDNPENPHIIQNVISAIGGTPVKFEFQNECCGSYNALKDKENVRMLVNNICQNAINNEAEIIVTVCPLCLYNLKKYSSIPVVYLTELMAKSLGIEVEGY